MPVSERSSAETVRAAVEEGGKSLERIEDLRQKGGEYDPPLPNSVGVYTVEPRYSSHAWDLQSGCIREDVRKKSHYIIAIL